MSGFRGLCLAAEFKQTQKTTPSYPVVLILPKKSKASEVLQSALGKSFITGLTEGNCLRLSEREVFSSLRITRKGDLKMIKEFCTKPQEHSKAPSQAPDSYKFRVPLHKPTAWEKKIIVWSGRFKKEDEIPETVSFELLDAAKNRVRVKVSYIMIALTILGCIVMIFQGKQAAKRHETLTSLNLEKKARLRKEAEEALESKTN